MQKTSPEPLLSIANTAKLLRVPEKTIRRWIKARELTAAQLGNQWRIRPRDLDLFVRDRLGR
ncbi:MAG: helix-turn-helix domain-containing protein [Alphaproteobacteria bacterium]|jgi:excisionase family DNA binding protein